MTKVTYKSVAEKFEDKGIGIHNLILKLPPITIFDPSCLELSHIDTETAEEIFKKSNRWRIDFYNEKLQELDIWIDYQRHR